MQTYVQWLIISKWLMSRQKKAPKKLANDKLQCTTSCAMVWKLKTSLVHSSRTLKHHYYTDSFQLPYTFFHIKSHRIKICIMLIVILNCNCTINSTDKNPKATPALGIWQHISNLLVYWLCMTTLDHIIGTVALLITMLH